MVHNVSRLIKDSVTLELEGIDRMYLNGYIPSLQTTSGFAGFVKYHMGLPIVSTSAVAPISRNFIEQIKSFARSLGIDLIRFKKGERKDDVAKKYLHKFKEAEGVLFIGKTQEKVRVLRTEKRRNPKTGTSYPWVVKSTAMVNQYYFYLVDRDFGPLFIKFSSYFPYTVKVCLNGHEWLKKQLDRRGIRYEALDNGILRCADPKAAQRISHQLDEKKIEAVFRKWLRKLPHPFTRTDQREGYRYDLSILQAEFSLTQVLDRPQSGRQFFEEVIRENIDLGRPDQIQLIFQRKVIPRTPGSFRTRVITQGVTPSLHVQYKNTRIKQYHKEGRALRTETTINNTYDFNIGRRLQNLPLLREVGFNANRRLLDVQTISHDCRIGGDLFESVITPKVHKNQRTSGLKFGCPRVMALMHALILFSLLLRGFTNRDLREHMAPLLGLDPDQFTPGRMTYDLRRLRLHCLIERIPKSHRYRVTEEGFRIAFFFSRVHDRLFRTGLSLRSRPNNIPKNTPGSLGKLTASFDQFVNEHFYRNAM